MQRSKSAQKKKKFQLKKKKSKSRLLRPKAKGRGHLSIRERYGAPQEDQSLRGLKLMQRIKGSAVLQNLSESVKNSGSWGGLIGTDKTKAKGPDTKSPASRINSKVLHEQRLGTSSRNDGKNTVVETDDAEDFVSQEWKDHPYLEYAHAPIASLARKRLQHKQQYAERDAAMKKERADRRQAALQREWQTFQCTLFLLVCQLTLLIVPNLFLLGAQDRLDKELTSYARFKTKTQAEMDHCTRSGEFERSEKLAKTLQKRVRMVSFSLNHYH